MTLQEVEMSRPDANGASPRTGSTEGVDGKLSDLKRPDCKPEISRDVVPHNRLPPRRDAVSHAQSCAAGFPGASALPSGGLLEHCLWLAGVVVIHAMWGLYPVVARWLQTVPAEPLPALRLTFCELLFLVLQRHWHVLVDRHGRKCQRRSIGSIVRYEAADPT